MSDQRRVSEIYVDVDKARLMDVNNSILTAHVTVFRRSQLLFRCHLRKSDGITYFTPITGTQWLFVIDNSYDPAHADLVVSDNDQFNIAEDWDALDAVNGKICFRVDTATTALTAAMGNSSMLSMTGELWMIPPGQNPSLVIQFGIDVKNIVADVGADSSLIYTNTNMLVFDGDDIVLLFPDGSVAQRWSR